MDSSLRTRTAGRWRRSGLRAWAGWVQRRTSMCVWRRCGSLPRRPLLPASG